MFRFTPSGWAQYLDWVSLDVLILKKLNSLIRECAKTPFSGTGKPEPLKGDFHGFWSRRINEEHRLIYAFDEGILTIVGCRYCYDSNSSA